MAGIGFKIQKLLNEDTYWGALKGYVFSAVISSGPWLISILCIGGIGALSQTFMSNDEHAIFRSWVMVCYMASLIVTGALQMAVTRYLSDCIHSGENDKLFSSFASVSLVVILFQLSSGWLYLSICGFSPTFIFLGGCLYAIITEIWIAMIYLSAARDYFTIVLSYFVGALISYASAWLLAQPMGMIGTLAGYTIGQTVLLGMLTGRVLSEFPIAGWRNFAWVGFMKRHLVLCITGLAYNSAIWVDKVLYWIYMGETLHTGLYSCPFYETPAYIAYITIVPSLSIFLVRVETSFYNAYRKYYLKVEQKFGLKEVLQSKAEMMDSLKLSLYRLLIFQGSITAIAIAYSPYLVEWFKLEAHQLPVLRITILGAFIHALLMVLFIIILYFDWKVLAMQCSVLFFFSNLGLTRLCLELDLSWQGYGYCISCLITVCYGAWKFLQRFDNLEYITFNRQPLGHLSWDREP